MMIIIYTDGGERTVPHDSAERTCGLDHRWHEGIGLATARLFHEQGYAVLITGANPETLEAARRNLPSEIIVLRADAPVP